MVANAVGTVTAAGCEMMTPSQSPRSTPNVVATTAEPDSPPPTTRPATAPAAVRPRHQMPRTSSGQKVDAATANASSTAWATGTFTDKKVSTTPTATAMTVATRNVRMPFR